MEPFDDGSNKALQNLGSIAARPQARCL